LVRATAKWSSFTPGRVEPINALLDKPLPDPAALVAGVGHREGQQRAVVMSIV
jgi:hypothetical protein